MRTRFALLIAVIAAVASVCAGPAQTAGASGPLHFRITLAPGGARAGAREAGGGPGGGPSPHGTAGRLFVLMSDSPQHQEKLETGFVPGETWLSATEVRWLAPGQTIDFDPDVLAYPQPFSRAKPGNYQFMALLDTDHSYAYTGENAGDLYGPVITVHALDPAHAAPVALPLDRRIEATFKPVETDTVKLAEFRSPLLSAFWGRPITMRAGVVLPPDYSLPGRRYAAVYHVHGYGGDYSDAWRVPVLQRQMSEGKRAAMVHVFLDASFSTGHHAFADSVNNGPWGRALTEEFIPYLEGRFPLVAKPYARFLTGHSSGGWSTLWLQISHPDYFGGTWSTSPDPVDFRAFTGVDVTPGSADNFYHKRDGSPRNLVRMNGREIATIEAFARQELVQGDYGGQFASFEYVFSPKGPDGRPMPLFNRDTGRQDPEVQRAWQKYDVRRILEEKWPDLGPKLKGKIHVICGAEDTFHLDEAVRLLQQFFKKVGSDSVCEIIPGRDHFNLYQPCPNYPDGLAARIDREMAAAYASRSAMRDARYRILDAGCWMPDAGGRVARLQPASPIEYPASSIQHRVTSILYPPATP